MAYADPSKWCAPSHQRHCTCFNYVEIWDLIYHIYAICAHTSIQQIRWLARWMFLVEQAHILYASHPHKQVRYDDTAFSSPCINLAENWYPARLVPCTSSKDVKQMLVCTLQFNLALINHGFNINFNDHKFWDVSYRHACQKTRSNT